MISPNIKIEGKVAIQLMIPNSITHMVLIGSFIGAIKIIAITI